MPLFAVGHIYPVHTTINEPVCDIERDIYAKWNEEFERLDIAFMLSEHMHEAYVLNFDSEINTLPHTYPVIIGSACLKDDLWGTALIIGKTQTKVFFTNSNCEIKERYVVDYDRKRINKI